jgi:hypothetical protein
MNQNICLTPFYVWDSGDLTPVRFAVSDDSVEDIQAFKERSGATKVVKLRWTHAGHSVECPFPAVLLPDSSGVVLYDEWHLHGAPTIDPEPCDKHLRVLSPDGSVRCTVHAPVIDERSVPQERWVDLPRAFPEYGVPWGAPASDGWRDIVIEVDWQTGQMLRWVPAPYLRY